jgi:hypothetical protein
MDLLILERTVLVVTVITFVLGGKLVLPVEDTYKTAIIPHICLGELGGY